MALWPLKESLLTGVRPRAAPTQPPAEGVGRPRRALRAWRRGTSELIQAGAAVIAARAEAVAALGAAARQRSSRRSPGYGLACVRTPRTSRPTPTWSRRSVHRIDERRPDELAAADVARGAAPRRPRPGGARPRRPRVRVARRGVGRGALPAARARDARSEPRSGSRRSCSWTTRSARSIRAAAT